MYVQLLSVTDDRAEAWRHSRVLQEDADINMEEMEKTPFSLHSLKRYTFKVEMARVMLDLMVNFTKTMWSQSSRIIPMDQMVIDTDFVVDGDLEATNAPHEMLKNAVESAAKGVPQDIVRLETPIMARLGWCFSMDLRTLVGFLKSLEKYQPQLYSLYGLEILKAMGWTETQFHQSPFGELVFIEPDLFDHNSFHDGIHYIEGVGEDMYNLISQFNRHAETTILTSLWVTPMSKLMRMKMSDKINYYYMINKHVYKTQILSHRACWIADWNNWANRIAQFYRTPEEIRNLLPCKCEHRFCKYRADLQARIEGKDPNPPCPIFTQNLKHLAIREVNEGKNFMTEMYRKLLQDG